VKRHARREEARRTGKPFVRQEGSRQPFKRAIAMFEEIRLALADKTPLERVKPYVSRGHGRGGREPKHGAARSKYMPHQGARECERRRIGGFAFKRWCAANAGLLERAGLCHEMKAAA
jgi:hypothetical protein